ncbi:MAG: hypothetical protein AAGI22_17795 [Planctomycetota bacterium]
MMLLALSIVAAPLTAAAPPQDGEVILLQGTGMGSCVVEPCGVVRRRAASCGVVRFGETSSPSVCPIGFRVTETVLFGATERSHLDSGLRSEVTTYRDGTCPRPPFLGAFDLRGLGDDPADLGRIPKVLASALACVPPMAIVTSELSAGPWDAGLERRVPTSGDGSLARFGTRDFERPRGREPFQPFLDAFAAAEDLPPEESTGKFGWLARASLGSRGMAFRATVRTRHHAASALAPVGDDEIRLEGHMTADGRFDVVRTRRIPADREGDVVAHQTTFDGDLLRNLQLDAEWGNAHALSGSTPDWVTRHYLARLSHVHRWLTDVLDLSMFRCAVFETSKDDPRGLTLLEQVHTDTEGHSFVGERYELLVRDGRALPIRRTLLDAAGTAWVEEVYSDYFEYRAADWRPRTIELTRRLTPDPFGPKVVTTVTVHEATPLDEQTAEVVPGAPDAETLWAYWLEY